MYYTTVRSPLGELLLIASPAGLTGLYPPMHVRLPAPVGTHDDKPFIDAIGQLEEYFDGRRQRFEVQLDLAGTAFQQRVWTALRQIPFGQTRTYGELALELGQPTASRAVGLANGRNPLSIVLPCHRVVGRSGALTGYAGGLAAKRWLLDHEARIALAA
ncbi:MAG TPA: methylated-DNA--[protein]-cysteine S-methyltransferase [Jatrophihabitans sp.]|nr:methylated-DNA--[protein]-cysteine S-methyltransferase [Jatrophihabitans sp.]